MSDEKPYFRFNPGAYQNGRSFEQTSEVCDVCARPCAWRYTGNIYAEQSPIVCARCIASGSLGGFLNDAEFTFHDIELNGADPALEDELFRRTPGVACFNPFEWPVLDAKPLAFAGYGEDRALLSLAGVRSAIDSAFAVAGGAFDGPTPYALIFKEIEGERYRAVIDLD
ncbi:CbrC family protein [Enterovirga sp. GCM10030262]|uniref:CbrC family protein n=1 Tax=Enterovirga sp. GCM10030262 TaxID=3273391 RepID=UPI003609B822